MTSVFVKLWRWIKGEKPQVAFVSRGELQDRYRGYGFGLDKSYGHGYGAGFGIFIFTIMGHPSFHAATAAVADFGVGLGGGHTDNHNIFKELDA